MLICISLRLPAAGQNSDSLPPVVKTGILRKITKPFTRSRPKDTGLISQTINTNNEQYFLPHVGKIIRHIQIRQFRFNQSFDDTTRKINYFGTKILDAVHTETRLNEITHNIYLKEGTPLSAVMAADNERHLRTLPYIRDARILIFPVPGAPDSVDLQILTKDLFSFNGRISSLSGNRQRFTVEDVNLFGMGQSLYATILNEKSRIPNLGYELGYKKMNLGGSFLNAGLKYTNITPNIYTGQRNEAGYTLTLERPLISQYKKWAGALTITEGKTKDQYELAPGETDLFRYHYRLFDIWTGMNLHTKYNVMDSRIHTRQFIAMRYFNYHFLKSPFLPQINYDLRYDDREALLAQYTFFKQDFYKTRYLFGFGVTEDIPYGYNIAFIGGYYRQKQLKRPYLGLDANWYRINAHGDIFQYFARSGTYFKHRWEDLNVLLGATLYSRLFQWERHKLRFLNRISYSEIFSIVASDPLRINNAQFGLYRFGTDSVMGRRRISWHSETILFTPRKVFGFSASPFISFDLSLLTPYHSDGSIEKSILYHGIGGGFRTRNENLVFGTIEVRATYFPKKVEQQKSWEIGMKMNLRFRYNSNYVTAPNVTQMNGDIYNTIY